MNELCEIYNIGASQARFGFTLIKNTQNANFEGQVGKYTEVLEKVCC